MRESIASAYNKVTLLVKRYYERTKKAEDKGFIKYAKRLERIAKFFESYRRQGWKNGVKLGLNTLYNNKK